LPLKNGRCDLHSNDLGVCNSSADLYADPDAVVVRDPPKFQDAETPVLLNPTLIIEVLLRPTEAHDGGDEFAHDRRLRSLEEYALVSSERFCVERYLRPGEHAGVHGG
jgi:Uma2 family endonuclease